MAETNYLWFWNPKPGWDRGTPPRVFDRNRKGERCRVVARGAMNSGLLEFADGYRVVTSRSGLRKAPPTPGVGRMAGAPKQQSVQHSMSALESTKEQGRG